MQSALTIRTAYLLAGLPLDGRAPRLAMVVEGITRGRGTRPARQAAPVAPDVLRLLLAACPPAGTALGACDRAKLLLGFRAALRRSELVALRLGDIKPVPGRGLRLSVRRSKTDQHGKGQDIAVWANPAEPLLCPAIALDAWLQLRTQASDLEGAAAESARRERPLFCAVTKAGRPTGAALSDKAVARLVKGATARLPRPGALQRPLAARRPRHRGRRRRRRPARPHAPNPAQEHPGGARLPPPRRPVAQQRHPTRVRGQEGRGGVKQPAGRGVA